MNSEVTGLYLCAPAHHQAALLTRTKTTLSRYFTNAVKVIYGSEPRKDPSATQEREAVRPAGSEER